MYLYCCEGCKLDNSLDQLHYLRKIKNIVLYVYFRCLKYILFHVEFPIEEIKF